MPTRELATFDDFRKATLGDTGFIVITGSARSPIVHKLNGRCITSDNFRVKVMVDGKVTGKYYWADSLSSAAKELGAALSGSRSYIIDMWNIKIACS